MRSLGFLRASIPIVFILKKSKLSVRTYICNYGRLRRLGSALAHGRGPDDARPARAAVS